MEPGIGASLAASIREKLPRAHRLTSNEVTRILRAGRKITLRSGSPTKAQIDARIWTRGTAIVGTLVPERASGTAPARLAVAVPKRLLKLAVDRNLVKRWMREAFRRHHARAEPMDALLTLTAKVDLNNIASRRALQQQIDELVMRAAEAARKHRNVNT